MFAKIMFRSSSEFNPANSKNNRLDGIAQSLVLLPQKQISSLGPGRTYFVKTIRFDRMLDSVHQFWKWSKISWTLWIVIHKNLRIWNGIIIVSNSDISKSPSGRLNIHLISMKFNIAVIYFLFSWLSNYLLSLNTNVRRPLPDRILCRFNPLHTLKLI